MNIKRNISIDMEVGFMEDALDTVSLTMENAIELLEKKKLKYGAKDITVDQIIKVTELLMDEQRFLIEKYQSVTYNEEFNFGTD